jgi:hypothetical protein
MPDGHRFDRRYCSSTCRQRNFKYWRTPEGLAQKAADEVKRATPEYQAWEAGMRKLVDLANALDGRGGGDGEAREARKRRQEIETRAKETAEVCGICGADTPPTQPVWRSDWRSVMPVCYACRCHDHGQPHDQGGRCEKCRPSGSWSRIRWSCPDADSPDPTAQCSGCHRLAWRPAKPCEGCGRCVMDHIHNRPRYRRLGHNWYATGKYEAAQVRVVCCERCRRAVSARERSEKRAEREPIDCSVCGERVDTRRRDTRYCSGACRQQAYRARKSVTP